MKNAITVHCIVKNEERWIWYAISSVKDLARQILIYDTGSSDKTIEIIKSFKEKKIIFEEKGPVTPAGLTKLRIEQLKRTKTEWLMILDGDEIWPKNSIQELETQMKKMPSHIYGIVTRAWNPVGDIYHYHPESIYYHWPFAPKDFLGWANLRLVRATTPNLNIQGDYPLEAYCQGNVPIQSLRDNLLFLKNRYFHMTYLLRSTSRKVDRMILNRSKKGKLEFGIPFPKNFAYPEVFYEERPLAIPNPWQKRPFVEALLSLMQSPFKELRRRLFDLYNPKPSKYK